MKRGPRESELGEDTPTWKVTWHGSFELGYGDKGLCTVRQPRVVKSVKSVKSGEEGIQKKERMAVGRLESNRRIN